MQQFVRVLFLAVMLAGCANQASQRDGQADLGWIDRSVLEKPEHHQFKEAYDTVQVESRFVEMIKQVDDGVSTIVFLGTWCSDSRREVPRFLKTVDLAGIPPESIRLYALDRSKKSADGFTDKYQIERVPTFIFLKNGEEVGRIVETPRTSIEGDMLMIMGKAR